MTNDRAPHLSSNAENRMESHTASSTIYIYIFAEYRPERPERMIPTLLQKGDFNDPITTLFRTAARRMFHCQILTS